MVGKMRLTRFLGILTFTAVVFGFQQVSAVDEPEMRARYGKDVYMDKCAACHGADGRGGGPVAEWLSLKPANLRVLAKNNGGEYPFGHVYAVIEGRTAKSGEGAHGNVRGHGTRDMPIWGKHFHDEAAHWSSSEVDVQEIVHARILGLVYYIQTLQEK